MNQLYVFIYSLPPTHPYPTPLGHHRALSWAPCAIEQLPTSYLILYMVVYVSQSVQSLSRVRLFATPWIAACQASLSITNSWGLLKLTSIESVIPSNHLILCHPLFLLPSILPSLRVFSNESVLHIRWPNYCSFSFSISPSNEHSGLISYYSRYLLCILGLFAN